MKKVLLFFIMVLLVVISARSLLCKERNSGINFWRGNLYKKETQKLRRASRAVRQEYDNLRRSVDSVFARTFDEASLEVVLRLFDFELQLVKNLLNSKKGHEVQELLRKRDKLLKVSTKTVIFIYETVMNFATSDILFTGRTSKEPGSILRGLERRNYLRRMEKILSQYSREFKDKQYYVSQRTLGLAESRYRPYMAQASQRPVDNETVYTSIDTHHDLVSPEPFEYYMSIEKNCAILSRYTPLASWAKKVHSRLRRRKKRTKFVGLWDSQINRAQVHEVPSLVSDVLALIDGEKKGHVSSFGQRNKMFYNDCDDDSMYTAIDVDSTSTTTGSRTANILFGSIRDAATQDTIQLGGWNPDIYEENLERYAAKLKAFKKEYSQKIQQLNQELQSRIFDVCEEFQQPVDGFIEKLSYNELPEYCFV